jgi:hypothetical protein
MRTLLALMAGSAAGALAAAQDVRVDASVNANRIGVQDVLQLTVTIEGGSGEPRLAEIDGFRVRGRSTSSQVSIVGGQMTSTNAYIYQLLPEREGSFTIGPISVDVGGERYRTEPIAVEVVAGSLVPRGGGRSISPFGSRSRATPKVDASDVYLKAEVSKSSVYQGEAIVVTYKLYSPYVPLGPQIEEDPALTGFWAEEVDLDDDDTAERQTIEGEPYLVFPLKRRILFPTKTGAIDIPPLTLSTAFRLTTSDPFDAFFSRGSSPIVVRSDAVAIDVAPLPEAGRSREFTGAVGEFELAAELNRDAVDAGEAVTLTLSIAGRGNLRAIESPSLPEIPGFRTFDPKTEESLRASARGLTGSKRWEYVLVPETGGVKEIGPWSFQFFDPAIGSYVDASAGPLTLRVAGGAPATVDGLAPSSGSPREVTLLREDIRYLKDPPPAFGVRSTPYYGSTLFYLTLTLPVLWNLGLVAYLRRREKEKTHSSLLASRRANRMARRRLKRAAGLAADADRQFYEEAAAALYKYVGDKTSVSPSGLTTQRIDALLEGRGVSEETRAELLEVLSACDEARFTPGKRTSEEMETLRARAESLIVSVDGQIR